MPTPRTELLAVYRPVLDFAEVNSNAIYEAALKRDIGEHQLRMLGDTANKVMILGSGDLRWFLGNIGHDPTDQDIAGLGDYLEEHMLASADEELTVPTYPYGNHVPRGKKNRHLFTLAANNPTVHHEREQARLLTEEFFGVDDAHDDHDEPLWSNWDYMAEIWLARLSVPKAVKAFAKLLNEKQYLVPATLSLGKVAMDIGEQPDDLS